jgi:hypothetical protein
VLLLFPAFAPARGGAIQGTILPASPIPFFFRCRGTLRSVFAGVLLAADAHAATVVVNPSKDNTLFESTTGSESSGKGVSIFAGRMGVNDGDNLRRAVLAFDLASLVPAGSTINSVTLTLFLAQGGFNSSGQNVKLLALTADWGEGTSAGSLGNPGVASAADVTWIHRFRPGSTWTKEGGDFDPLSSARCSGRAARAV